MSAKPNAHLSWLARTGAGVVGIGFGLFLVGVYPRPIGLDVTPGIGLVQIFTFLMGTGFMTLGAYIYMYATRYRGQPLSLRQDIGLRLMATGVVIAFVTGLADVIGIGTHQGTELAYFGPVQAWGVAIGVLTIIIGIAAYSSKK
jgi:hypothetical protein